MAAAIVKLGSTFTFDADAFTKFGASLMYEADGVTQKAGSFDSIRNRIQNALDTARNAGVDLDLDGDNDAGYDGARCWVMDVFPATVVYSMDGDLFQCGYMDDGETVTLGTPTEVERSYTVVPSDGNESDSSGKEISRTLAVEAEELKESAYDSSKGVLTVTVIKPGFSKNKTKVKESGKTLPRYYPAATLKRDHKIFNGSKMFADHQTDAEAKARPEGSVRDWVASLGETWAESDGTVMGKATIIDPIFKSKLDTLNKNGLLKEMKTSVRIAAGVSEGEAEGKEAAVIESIFSNKSVDFVTYAGAGGQVEAMESGSQADVDLVSLEELAERRPDLVELIESRARNQISTEETVKTLEQQLKEANEKVTALTAETVTLKSQIAEADGPEVTPKKFKALQTENDKLIKENEELKTGQQKRDCASKLTSLLKESKLPEAAQKKLQERFKDATSEEDFSEAITEEREYVKTIAGPTKVRNLGEAGEVNHKANLVESFMGMGMTEEQAKVAAAGRAH